MLRKKAKDVILRLMPVGISGIKFKPPTITTWRTRPPINTIPTSTFMHSYVSDDNKREPRRSGQFVTTRILRRDSILLTRFAISPTFHSFSRQGSEISSGHLTIDRCNRDPARSNWLAIWLTLLPLCLLISLRAAVPHDIDPVHSRGPQSSELYCFQPLSTKQIVRRQPRPS